MTKPSRSKSFAIAGRSLRGIVASLRIEERFGARLVRVAGGAKFVFAESEIRREHACGEPGIREPCDRLVVRAVDVIPHAGPEHDAELVERLVEMPQRVLIFLHAARFEKSPRRM